MNQKQIGSALLIIAILLSVFVFIAKSREDAKTNLLIKQSGTCFLGDGTCLHEVSLWPYIFGWSLAGALGALAIYLLLFDKTQEKLAEHQKEVSSALRDAKKFEKEKDEFEAFLSGFTEDEQKVLKAIKEQDGIQQSTLRFRTGMSKAALSLMLASLEEKGIISKKESGKTNEVYLRKTF